LAFRSLACAHDRHADRLQGLAGDGRLRTRLAAAYPLLMIERVCRAVDVATRAPCTPVEDDPAEDVPAEGDCFSKRPGPSASARGQLSLSSRPAAPALRIGQVVDVDITRGGPSPHFANPFKMGPSGVDERLRDLATATYRAWLSARSIPAGRFPTRLPVCELLRDHTGEKVETALRLLLLAHLQLVLVEVAENQLAFLQLAAQVVVAQVPQMLLVEMVPPQQVAVVVAEILAAQVHLV
jgi:hypothetical protein